MAVWGIGAYYKGSNPADKTDMFISDGLAYIGWDEMDASALFCMFDSVKLGDIVYIKSFAPRLKKLHIKAIGIVEDTRKYKSHNLGTGIRVKWKLNFKPVIIDVTPEIYRNNVFNNTLYEEFNSSIIQLLVDELIK